MRDELAKARLKRERERLEKSERWTPRDALQAAIIDLDNGLLDAEVICVVVAERCDEGTSTSVTRYTGANGVSGPKDTFWVFGMLQVAIVNWIRS